MRVVRRDSFVTVMMLGSLSVNRFRWPREPTSRQQGCHTPRLDLNAEVVLIARWGNLRTGVGFRLVPDLRRRRRGWYCSARWDNGARGGDTPRAPGGGDAVTTLAVAALQPGNYQPRTRMDQEALNALAASIKAQGVMQPILVRPVGGGTHEIIAGERRWRAARIAGLSWMRSGSSLRCCRPTRCRNTWHLQRAFPARWRCS